MDPGYAEPVNPLRRPATATQRRLFDFISEQCRKGYPPSVVEMADHMGYASNNAIADVLKVLEKKGWIERDSDSSFAICGARAIRIRGYEE